MLFALLASFSVVVLDANVQSMLARSVAGYLSNKLDTEVKIKTFYISPDMRILAEDVLLNDKYHNTLFEIQRLDAKLSLRDLANELRIREVYLKDITANIVKYEDADAMNVTELFKKSDKDKDIKKKDNELSVKVDRLAIENGHVVIWNQNKDNPGRMGMDYSHLDIDSIHASFLNLSYKDRVVSAVMEHLSGSDKSGLILDTLSSKNKIVVSDKGLEFKDLKLKTQATSLDMDLYFYYNNYRAYLKFVDSVRIFAKIRPSQLTLSDLRYFAPVMGKMMDTLQIEGIFDGSVSDYSLDDFAFDFKDSTNFKGTIRMKGLPKFFDTHIYGDVEKMNFTYQDISEFYIPTPSGKIPLPESLDVLNEAMLSGTYEGFHNNFKTEFNLHTNVGNIYLNGYLNNDLRTVSQPEYDVTLFTNNINAAKLINMKDDFVITMKSKLEGSGFSSDEADMQLTLDVEDMLLFNNRFNDFLINGDFENQRLMLSTSLDDKVLKADLEGLMDVSENIPSFNIRLNVDKADLHALNISDKDDKMILATDISANIKGIDIDNAFGDITVRNTKYIDSRGSYEMDSLNLNITENHFDSKDISLACDFFDMNVNGIINFNKIGNTFKNYVLKYFYVDKWSHKNVKLNDSEQDFYLNMTLKDTEILSQLFMPKLNVANNTSLTATFTSRNYQLHSTLTSDYILFNGMKMNNIYIKNKTSDDKSTANITIDEFVIKEPTDKNPLNLSLENLNFMLDVHNDSLLLNIAWDDDIKEDRNKANINTSFVAYDNYGGLMHLTSSELIINDSIWNIAPSCYIDFKKDKTYVNNLEFYSGKQSVSLDGFLPLNSKDTLNIDFDNFDISNFDILTESFGIDVDGIINGDFHMSGLKKKFTFLSNLDIEDIAVNKHLVGTASLDANWNAPDTSIYIKTDIVRTNGAEDKVLSLDGKYFTSRQNNLDFDINLNGIDVSVITPFVKGTISRVSGYLGGSLNVVGSFAKPVILGDARLYDAACKIDYLNTYYRVNDVNEGRMPANRYIRFSENRIDLNNIVLTDTLGNHALARGVVTHNYLKDFSFDIDLDLDNFLAIDLPEEASASFYATAVANGDVKIKGPLDDIHIDIDAETMTGSSIDVNLTNSNTLKDNFIVFVQKDTYEDTTQIIVPEVDKNKKFTLNLNAAVDRNTNVDIHLPSNMGNISAIGSGDLRLGYALDQLSLYGDYVIDEGTFSFNFQNLLLLDFNIRPGSSLSWTGKAEDADINVVGSYRTKSSISSLGIEVDSTSLVSNINVDCIIRLQEKLSNPTITFGIELPNATDDIKNTVFSVIDTTNQAVMSQQIISLLVMGSFSYGNSNSSLYSIGASNYYNVLTSYLSGWLSQISKDFDVGVRYTPEDNLTAEELEVALSTQLFDDRLTIEGNFGMYSGSQNEATQGANNIVGDFDMTFKITNRLSLKAYNHSNLNSNYYSYTYEAYSDYTQGIGISYSQSFDNIREIFIRKNRNKKNKISKDNRRRNE